MADPRWFELGDILTITTGRLVARRHIDAVYDILNFMTGDNLFTHQLPRASDECRPSLLAQFPELAEVVVPESVRDRPSADAFLAEVEALYGKGREVAPLAAEDHTRIGPLDELGLMGIGPDRIIPVVVDEPDES